jgi:cysteinyl-tRNA synthetase
MSESKIQFFNTLSGKPEEFVPLKSGEVRMYTCGPTVYDYAHIGNFRAFVFEDLLRRFLEFKGFKVNHVMNLTDVDDKTIAGAQKQKKQLNDYTAQYIEAFNEDLKALNCLLPMKQPRATREIPEMLKLIERLIKNDAAYVKDGSVYYRVAKFNGYGKLSKKKLELNITGASERMDSDEYAAKEEATDFVLWKASKPGEAELGAAWGSPWGKGRPGWHIECSAMSMKELGESFDLHAGGEDLVFPHHENEIAQSEGATGKQFVKYWMHCRFLLVDGTKMSKSKGNFYTLRDLLAKGYDPMAVRYALLSTNYRTPLNFTLDGLKEAGESIRKFDDAYWQCVSRLKDQNVSGYDTAPDKNSILQAVEKITGWLGDDLNISGALAALMDALGDFNVRSARMNSEALDLWRAFFEKIDPLFGFNVAAEKNIPSEVRALMEQRLEVRLQIAEKNDKSLWGKSDELRNSIQALGWLVKDGKPGELSTLKKKRRVWDK